MKDWKFIQVGNTAHSDKVDVIKRLLAGGWSVQDIYDQLKTEGYEVEKNFIERLKTVNESIDKQEWSMFKGLTKKAEEEVGNEDIPTEQDLKNWIRMSQQDMKDAQREMEKNKPLGHPDSYREENYGRAKVKYDEAAKAIKKMEEELRQGKYKKVGNARSKEQLLADIRELTKYIKDNPDRPCEKEKRLLGEAKEELDKRYGVIVGNKAIYDDSGRFIIGYVEKNGNGYSAYTHGITGSKSYLLDAKDEKTAEAELKDYVKAYEKRTGNADTVSEYNAEIQRLTKKAEQLRRMGQGRSAMEIEKQIEKLGRELRELGNKKVGNESSNVKISLFKSPANHSWVPGINDNIIEGAPEFKGAFAKDEGLKWTKEWAKKHGLNVGNETLAEYAKSKPRIINETKAERKFGKVMGEFEEGALKTPQGKTVTDPAQAKAIAYSEADKVDNLKRARNAMKNKK